MRSKIGHRVYGIILQVDYPNLWNSWSWKIDEIKNAWNTAWNAIKDWASGVWNNITSGLSMFLSNLWNSWSWKIDEIKNAWNTAWRISGVLAGIT